MATATKATKAPRKTAAVAKGNTPTAGPPKQRVVALSDTQINRDLTDAVWLLLDYLKDAREADRLIREDHDDTNVDYEQGKLDTYSAHFDNAHDSIVSTLQMLVGDNGAVELADGTIVGVRDSLVEGCDFNQLYMIKRDDIVRLEG